MREEAHLPPLRQKILRQFFVLVSLYVGVGIFMMLAVYFSSGVTPQIIHSNYDSISAAMKMKESWNALSLPARHPEKNPNEWKKLFEDMISFEEHNITEPGEGGLASKIRNLWDRSKTNPEATSGRDFIEMRQNLDRLIELNEKGMFKLAEKSVLASKRILIFSIVLFMISLLWAIYLADGLAVKISRPIKDIAEALRRKPRLGTQLKLPVPTNFEMKVLNHEMGRLWDRLCDLQKLNLEELSVQGQKLETVLESVDDGIIVIDNRQTVVQCNEGMLELLGLKKEDVLYHFWADLSTLGDNYLRLRQFLNRDLSPDQSVELAFDGKKRIFSGRCRNILGKNDEPLGMMLYLLHDITENIQREKSKADFLGILSHELKTPLQSLGTASELLLSRKGQWSDEEQMLINTIHDDVARIRIVANEFIQVGSVDLSSLRLKLELTPLNEKLKEWMRPFHVLSKERNVRLEYIQEGSGEIWASVDLIKFPWAISNLLGNAVRVSPSLGIIKVLLSTDSNKVHIEIWDEGPGVPLEIRDKIFEPYFQAKGEGEQKPGFLGLGLTIAKEVVEAHHGEIQYIYREPHGSIFRITLPLISGHG
ncbi:MAG: sensory box histidine kinase [Bacteriovoracaceae bacterium]|nr:sensory box histidine kinase [Bacteriovoracaceae bacterium]